MLVLFSKEEESEDGDVGEPHFTAIVPAYNEAKSIEGTLMSLLNMEYPHEKTQIIVVNDGSTDATQEIVESVIAANPNRDITLINQQNQGKGCAMNVGLEGARGEYFACLDADSFVHADALKKMLPLFADDKVASVCPLLKVKKPDTMIQKVQWTEYVINMFYRFLNAKLNCIHVTPGPFSVYRTAVIKDLGGYDEKTITEDLEIAIRLQKHQYKILQTFDAIVETVSPDNWKALFKQRVRWYKGSVDNTIQYKELMFNKKYGDFGMVRMPTIIASGVIAIIVALALFQSLGVKVWHSFLALKDVNFDIWTLLQNYTWNVNWLNWPFFKITIAATLIGLSLFVMYMSFKLVKEKITNYGRTWISVSTYLLIYSLFLTTVWMYIAYLFVNKKKNSWGK